MPGPPAARSSTPLAWARCQHAWILPGQFCRVPRPLLLIAVSISSSDPTERSDSRSSGVTQRTWERGRRLPTTQLGSLRRRPKRCLLPELPLPGYRRCWMEVPDVGPDNPALPSIRLLPCDKPLPPTHPDRHPSRDWRRRQLRTSR